MFKLTYLLACVTYIVAQQQFPGETMPGCVFESVPAFPTKFALKDNSRGPLVFDCPENTKYAPMLCGCNWIGNPVNRSPEELEAARRAKELASGPFGRVNTGMSGGLGGGVNGILTTAMLPSTTTTRPPCQLRPHADRHKYKEFILGFDWMVRDCALGTLYNVEACACHDIDPNQVYSCHPELWINFNGEKIEDSAGYSITIGNNGNVVSVSNAGRFDGTGILTIWQYSNQWFSDGITINLRFYEFPGGVSDEQVLVANCFGLQLGSIEIGLDRRSKEVIFRIEAQSNDIPEGKELRIPFKEKAWKNVTMSFNGNFLRAWVDEAFKEIPLKGQIRPRYSGLKIGTCNGRGYVGYIDDLRVFRCVNEDMNGPPNTMTRPNTNDMGLVK